MANPTVVVKKALIVEADEAFAFHEHLAASDEHIFPRTREQVQRYCQRGWLFCARLEDSGVLVGLCYSIPEPEPSDEEDHEADAEIKEWEIGGLTVPPDQQKNGYGTALVRFGLAHTMVFHDPWRCQQQVITHVHVNNDEP